jgi:hypothetical protein
MLTLLREGLFNYHFNGSLNLYAMPHLYISNISGISMSISKPVPARYQLQSCLFSLLLLRIQVSIPNLIPVLIKLLLSKNLKIKIYKTILLQVVLYDCETWSLVRGYTLTYLKIGSRGEYLGPRKLKMGSGYSTMRKFSLYHS